MDRRTFLQHSSMAALAAGLGVSCSKRVLKSHVLSLSFDDGFRKSFYQVADIHEEFGLGACLNVIASGHLPEFKGVGEYVRPEQMGDFEDWNALVARGHEVMPHTWEHLKLTDVPLELAKENIHKCFDYFEANLDGYDPAQAVYNFAFNASNPELEALCLERCRAVRTGGWMVLKDTKCHALPVSKETLHLGCWAQGPDYCDDWMEAEVQSFLASEGGWLILNLHGLDGEGWGPLHSDYLRDFLRRMVKVETLDVLPTGQVIKDYLEA